MAWKRSRRFLDARSAQNYRLFPFSFLHIGLTFHLRVQHGFLEFPPIPQFEGWDAVLRDILIERIWTHTQVS